ncbi:hypothetical protein [Aureispira anguillae]|uniref:Lipoprotein n=1 Tax=Aureispira anguillae TaxID=2864201 RepID=A0A916DR01_9BACT|nr:hypothetical protein [Aureispira anguillae]BDS09926.1 hypothetical protein AsAng_0006310 [Aureispira anguillae]
MRLKKHVLKAPICILSFLIFYSCTITKNQRTKQQKSEKIFVYGAKAMEEEAYTEIKGSVARLQAMICGKYIYTYISDDAQNEDFSVWRTEDGQDSMIVCQIPIGDYRKIGYWVYHCQYLTSLPNDPVYQAFSKLVALNRDTIKAVYYEVPEGFKLDFTQKMVEIKENADKVDWNQLKISPDSTIIYYARQNLIKFKATSNMAKFSTPHPEIKYLKYHQVNLPNKILIDAELYDKNQQYLKESTPIQLIKTAAVHPNMYEY